MSDENEGQVPEASENTGENTNTTPPAAEPQGGEAPPAPAAEAKGEVAGDAAGETDGLPEWVLKERKQLRDEAAEHRVKKRELEQEKNAEIAKLQAEIDSMKHEQLRASVAAKHGLPVEIAARLKGDDKEALEQDAQELARVFAVGGPRNLRGGLNPGRDVKNEDVRKTAARLRGRR